MKNAYMLQALNQILMTEFQFISSFKHCDGWGVGNPRAPSAIIPAYKYMCMYMMYGQ